MSCSSLSELSDSSQSSSPSTSVESPDSPKIKPSTRSRLKRKNLVNPTSPSSNKIIKLPNETSTSSLRTESLPDLSQLSLPSTSAASSIPPKKKPSTQSVSNLNQLSLPSTSTASSTQKQTIHSPSSENVENLDVTDETDQSSILIDGHIIKHSRKMELLKNPIILAAYLEENRKLKYKQEQAELQGDSAESEVDDGTVILHSEPRSSPYYPKNPSCKYECAFEMRVKPRPENAVGKETMKEYRKRVKMILKIDDSLLNEIVRSNHKPRPTRSSVNSGKMSKEERDAEDFASRKRQMKKILYKQLLEDSRKAVKEKTRLLREILELSDKQEKRKDDNPSNESC